MDLQASSNSSALNTCSIEDSINHWNSQSFEKYRSFLDTSLKLHSNSTIFHYSHLENILKIHKSSLESEQFFYKEKLFYLALELKKVDVAEKLLKELKSAFGREAKIIRMEASFNEITENYEFAIETFKKLIKASQEDRVALKRYLATLKIKFNLTNIKEYTEFLSEYLKVYMDDIDVWFELSDIYLLSNNYNKAIFCLEEVLLFYPNNYAVYTKIGDVLNSFNNTESALSALKYYSQSVLIKPTLKAFWGIFYACNIALKYNKTLDEKNANLMKIAKISILDYYADSPMKKSIEEILA
jgi:ER membrane protein complex subunit 2